MKLLISWYLVPFWCPNIWCYNMLHNFCVAPWLATSRFHRLQMPTRPCDLRSSSVMLQFLGGSLWWSAVLELGNICRYVVRNRQDMSGYFWILGFLRNLIDQVTRYDKISPVFEDICWYLLPFSMPGHLMLHFYMPCQACPEVLQAPASEKAVWSGMCENLGNI